MDLPKAPQRTNIRTMDADLCLTQGVPRFLLLGAYTTRGAGVTSATSTPRGRRLLQLVHQLARAGGRPKEEYLSISLSSHSGLATHVDANNHLDHHSWHVGLGTYKGGLLRLSRDAAGENNRAGLRQVRNQWTEFDGTGQHGVTPVEPGGKRYGITLFTPNHLERLKDYDWEILKSYQFPCRRIREKLARKKRAKMEAERRGGGDDSSDVNPEVVKAADQYLEWVIEHPNGTALEWKEAVHRGAALLQLGHSSVANAVKAVWACRRRRNLDNLRNAAHHVISDHLEPSWAAYLQFVSQKGMPARSEVPRAERTRQQAMPHPSATNELSQVYRSLWKDIRKGRILLVPTEQLNDTVVQSSPLAAVPKMLPDRTLAAECRVVHDQRITNQFCPSYLHPPALQPKHSQIVRLVKWWQTMLPGIPVMIAKRDISSAFRLIWVDPEDCEVFAADLPWRPLACAADTPVPVDPSTSSTAKEREELWTGVTAIFMVMSFGFTGAPGEWAPWGLATTALHRAYIPADPFLEGPWSFHSHILVDDAILVEPQIGNRPEISAYCYEENTRALLGEDSINQEKVQLEGEYGCEATVWGLVINTTANTIGLPEQRLLKGAHLLALPAYTAGNRDLTLRDVQRLRGTAQSWTTVLPGLRLGEFVQPNVRWGEEEAWEQLWASFDLLKLLVSRPELWKERFVASMNRLLTVSEQLGLPGAHLKARVVSSDATPQMHGAVDWKARKVTRQEVTPFMVHLARQGEDEQVIIAVAELLGLVAMAAALGHTWREETVIYIGDNSNVVHWLRSRAPRNRLARLLMRALMCLEVKEKFVIHPYYVRTYHNTTADWLTRCTDAEFEEGLKLKGFTWLDAGMPWREALMASERGDLLFLVGMDAADMQVMQALAVKHIARAETAGFTPLDDWELCDMDGEEGDYLAVWQGWGGMATCWTPKKLLCAGTANPANSEKHESQDTTTNTSKKLLCAGTAPPDPSGTRGLKLAQMAVTMGAEAVTFDAPRNHDWSRAERFLRESEKGWNVTVFQFDTSALGAAVWRKRGALLGRKGGHDRVKTPEELGLQTVLGTPARHFLRVTPNEQPEDEVWVARPEFVLEPQLGKVFTATGPRGAGHIHREGSRTLVCSVGNPLPAPHVVDGRIEIVEVWDPKGKAGHLRRITPAEWQSMQQGKARGASATMASAVKSLQQPGAAVAAVLIVATVT
eukprot:6188068-Amphidinium_carterae.1